MRPDNLDSFNPTRLSAHFKSLVQQVFLLRAVVKTPTLAAFLVVILVTAVLTATAFMQKAEPGQAPAQAAQTLTRRDRYRLPAGEIKQAEAAPDAAAMSPEALTAGTYAFTATAGVPLEDMSSGTTTISLSDPDDGSPAALSDIGFDFWYDGVRFTQFGVNANGFARLGAIPGATSIWDNSVNFASVNDSPKLAPFYDDLCVGTGGKVHFKITGAAPNRKLVVEWKDMQITRGALGCTGAGGGNFQMWLYESGHSTQPGMVQFVYGPGMVTADAADEGYAIGLQSGAAANFASVTTNGGTVSYATANNTQTDAIPSGSSYRFSPNIPTAPGGNGVTGISQTSLTLNWLDNAGNEVGYVIYRSTDNVNFSFLTQTAANAISFMDTGRAPNTTYFYHVNAVTEGALSANLNLSATTLASTGIQSTAAGGNWSNPATWVGGVVPTAVDSATIVDGATVTIDVTTATCLNLTVGQGTSGVLQYIATPAATLTVNGDATVAAGGTFSAGAGSLATHVLNIGGSSTASAAVGNLTVNGTFDMNTTAGVTTNFFGSTSGTLSGTGPTADFFSIVGQKGTTQTAALDVTRVVTIASPAASGSRLTVNGGTIKFSSATTATPWFGSNTITGANGKLWINNAAASLQCVGTGVSATGGGSPTITGALQVDAGTFGYGQGNNTMQVGGTVVVGGANAAINMFGAISFNANSSFTVTAGNINIDPQNVASLAATGNILRFTGPNTVNASGGTITIVDPHSATGTGRALSISTGAGSYNFSGNTIRFGNGVSTTAGSVDGFDIDTFVGNSLIPIGNVIVDNTATNAATRFVRANVAVAPLQVFILGDLTITNTGGSRFNLNGNLVAFGKNIVNNGTLDGTTAASRLYWTGNGVASNYLGTGTCTAPLASWDLDNPLGVTIDPGVSQIVTLRANLFRGTNTNSNKLTLGNGGVTTAAAQVGVASSVAPGGSFDQAPIFNAPGGYGIFYAQESVGRTTGFEIPASRDVNFINVNNTNHVTLAGGNLVITTVGAIVGNATLAAGRVITGNNTLILNSATTQSTVTRTLGYVDGNLRKTYTATGSKTFEVGTANGYSPVTVNATAGTFPSDFTVKGTQGQAPYVSGPNALARYWTLTGTGLTANLTFTYLATDVVGPLASYQFIKNSAGTVSILAPAAPPTTTSATINGVSSFSDWTLGEVIPGSLQFSAPNFNDSETNADHTATITVTRTGGSGGAVGVSYATSAGTASSSGGGADYTNASGTLSWAAGDSSPKTFTVPVKGDTTPEPDETVNLALGSPSGGATVGLASTATLTIVNDDAPIQFVVRTTGDDSDGSCGATCTLRAAVDAANADPDFNLITFNINADDPGCTGGVCTITTQDLAVQKQVYVIGPGPEALTVSGGTGNNRIFNVSPLGGPAVVTIKGMTLESGDIAIEGAPGGAIYAAGVKLLTLDTLNVRNNSSIDSGGGLALVEGPVAIVNSTISGNSGGSCGGLIAQNTALTITNSTISGNTTGSYGGGMCLYGSTVATIRKSTITGNNAGGVGGGGIFNFNGSSLNLGNSIVAGNTGTNPDLFNDLGAGTLTSARYNLIGNNLGTNANGGDPFPAGNPNANNDIVGTNGSPINALLFGLGSNGGSTPTHNLNTGSPAIDKGSAVLAVTTDQRSFARPIEDGAVTNATGGDGSDIGAVEKQTFTPGTLQFSAATDTDDETNADHNVTITVTRTGGANGAVTVNYATAAGSATPGGSDYTDVSGTLSWANGDTADKSFTIMVKGDAAFEGNDTVNLALSSATGGATLGSPNLALLTITNDDSIPTISIDSVSVSEGGSNAVFTVTQSALSAVDTTFEYSTANGTADAFFDYTPATSEPKTIPSGSTSTTITVPILDDGSSYEGDETFTVTISNVVNANVVTGVGTGTINDNDPMPSFSIDDVTHNEGNGGPGSTSYTFTITMTGETSVIPSISYETINGTATAPSDFIAITTTPVTFFPPQTTEQITVFVNGDTDDEATEAFTVHLSAPVNATIADADGTGAITNDDTLVCPATLTVNDGADAADAIPGDGICATGSAVCTLRAALEESNALTACAPLTINFDLPGSGPHNITLLSALPPITRSVSIQGPTDESVSVSGATQYRVFEVTTAGAVSISNLSVIQGSGGFGNGGGLRNSGAAVVTVANSTFADNSAFSDGGAIYNAGGTLNLINTTISGNTAQVFNDPVHGGGIFSNGGTLNLTNCTISGNSAVWDTVTDAIGGGVAVGGGAANVRNTIISGNTADTSSPDVFGVFVDKSNNLIGDNTGSTGFTNGVNGSQVGDTGAPINADLGPLADNGGPTFTRGLQFGSRALEAGNDCVLTANGCGDGNPAVATDQRGVGRPQAIHVDIGAFEAEAYAVNTTDDPGDGICSAAPGGCTFREAINAANAASGPRLIVFNIPANDPGHFYYTDNGAAGFGPTATTTATNDAVPGIDPDYAHTWWSIHPLTALPAITNRVFIDGYSQTGASFNTKHLDEGDDAVLRLELNGGSLASGVGLDFETGSSSSTLRGLVINHYSQVGVLVNDDGSDTISGNFIGTDVSGTLPFGSSVAGISLANGGGAFIGGDTPELRNLISSNATGAGLLISASSGNIVEGNYIGTDRTGAVALANGAGVQIQSGSVNNTVGCAILDGDNLISGNTTAGVSITSGSGNFVQGNFIGTDKTGTAALPNGKGVVVTDSANNFIGVPFSGNLISGNSGDGILIHSIGSPTTGNQVMGNFVGTNRTGAAAIANTGAGVELDGASNNFIGGTNFGEGNVISGNSADGLEITGGASNNLVQANLIGLTADGLGALGNSGSGIEIYSVAAPGSSDNNIGGQPFIGARPNRAAFAAAAGCAHAGASGKRMTTLTSSPASPQGISSAANIIANNGIDGVRISNPLDVNNLISENSIFSNAGLGINLGVDGVTANDTGDGDDGANHLQNFPVITVAAADTQTISGTLDSGASTFTIEFFSNNGCDASGHGEGKTFIGSTSTSAGSFSFTVPPASFTAGQVITATATNIANNTSEFSACAIAVPSAVSDLSITKTAPATVTQGNNFTYTITVSNSASAAVAATGVTVSDTLPSGVTFVSASAGCLESAGVVSCTGADIPLGGSDVFTIQVTAGAPATVSNTAATSAANDPNSPHSSTAAITQINAQTIDYTVTTTGNAIVVTDISGNSDLLTATEVVGGFIKFSAAARFFSVNGGAPINGDSGNLSLIGVISITVNQGNGDDTFNLNAFTTTLPNLTINGDAGDDTVNFNGTVTFIAGSNLDVDLQNDAALPGVDRVNIAGSSVFLNGAGTATIKASSSVTFTGGSTLQVQNGDLTIEANQQAIPTAGDFNGVDVQGSIFSVGSGNILIKGTGGAGDFEENLGVALRLGGNVNATVTGAITVQGTGGDSTGGASATAGSGNLGIYVSGSGSQIVSNSGSILITGQGGTTVGVAGTNVIGVSLDELGTVQTNGAGSITINGTGGTITNGGDPTFVNSGGVFVAPGDINGDAGLVQSTGTGANAGAIIITGVANNGGNGSAQGVRVDNPGAVTTVDGPITITGTAAACGNACLGTSIRGSVSATGAGAINLTGTGAATTGVFPTHGTNIRTGGIVSVNNGNITITGTGGNGADNAGFNMASSGAGTLLTTGSGSVTVNADTVRLNPTAAINAGANAVSLRQKTNGFAMNLGSVVDNTANTVELSDAELDRITCGTLNLGNLNSGAITTSSPPITRSAATIMNLISGANIDVATGSISSGGGGNVTLNSGTNVFPSNSGVDVNSGAGTLALTSGKVLKIVINSTTVDSGYTQLNVAGLVNLNGTNLSISGTHVPAVGQTFIIVNNDNADPITGTFNLLPEGALITNFLGTPLRAQISYVGGSGNDAVLTVTAPPTAAPGSVSGQILDNNGVPVEGAGVRLSGTQNRLTVTDANGFYNFDNVETNGFYTVTPARVNFSFSPAQRSFSQLANHTDAAFAAWSTGNALNPLDTTEYFIRQQYVDFLGREPDEAGLNFWYNNVENCRSDANCRAAKRIDTSAAFFLSIEFQQTGYLVYRTYQAAYGNAASAPVPVRLGEFKPDSAAIGMGVIVNQPGWQSLLENNKQTYMSEFVQRARFVAAYPTTLTPWEFVDQLFRNAGVIPADNDRAAAIGEFGLAETSADVTARARALRRVAENAAMARQESNRAFVLMQYFGYLRRDPNVGPDTDFAGYNFWLDKLNAFSGNFRDAEMVKAFLVSGEYRDRFGR
jgi:CSLREA domain-containing protein